MKNSINIEIERMKNLFVYQKGKVISEQRYLIKESEEDDIINYIQYYMDNKSCDEVANDLEKLENNDAITSQLTKDEKKQLKNAITGFKHPGTAVTFGGVDCQKGKDNCQCVKEYAIGEFKDKINDDRNKTLIKLQICAIAQMNPNMNQPTFCSTQQQTQPDATTQNTTTTTTQPDATATQTNTAQPDATQTTTTQPATTTQTNYELDSVDKIKQFQDWMDSNHQKWAYSKKYNRNYSVDKNPKKGYGNLGPNTKKAWANDEYKKAYLKDKGLDVKQVDKTASTTSTAATNTTQNVTTTSQLPSDY